MWDGNFNAEPLPEDMAPKVVVAGNDFLRLTGMAFYCGVPFEENRFDIGGVHAVLIRGGRGWDEALKRAEHDPDVRREVDSLLGRGPFGYAQDWQVYSQSVEDPEFFHFVQKFCGP